MKKLLSVLSAVLLLLTMMPLGIIGATAAGAPTISLVAPEQAFEMGATFTVDVVMANNPGIICWRTRVAYDSAVLELVDQTAGDAFNAAQLSFGPLRSPASAMWCDAIGDNFTTNGVMYTLTFRVLEDVAAGTYPLTLSVLYPEDDILNTDMNAVYFNLVSDTVTVVDHYHEYDNACDSDCNICGDVREVEPHKYSGAITTAPTCTEDGVKTYTCANCGGTYTESVPALGHDYKPVVTDPTCEAAGYTTHTCSRCGDSYVDSKVPALGHAYESVVTDPTCEAAGYTTHTCSRCGDSYVDSEVAALGHNYSDEITTAPTCTEDGVKTYTCANCGGTYTESVPALGHAYESVVTAPTCEAEGYTTHTCTRCDNSYVDTKVAALGHNYSGEITTAPTCTEDGIKTYTCANCGGTYTESVPATGKHTYEHACSESCSVCGTANATAAEHAYNHVYDVDCDVCGSVREVTILMGDLNGDGKVNIRDLGLLQQHLNGWEVVILTDVADLNGDGKINIRDLGLFQQYLNGWDVTLGKTA